MFLNLTNLLFRRKYPCPQFYRHLSLQISRLLLGANLDKSVTVGGWVKSLRKHGQVVFLHITDGSSALPLQVVVNKALLSDGLSFGCSVRVTGTLHRSTHRAQEYELEAEHVTVLGRCNAAEFPFKARQRQPLEYTRRFPHLRARTTFSGCMQRLRAATAKSLTAVLDDEGFTQIHTPVLTSNDCEGAGEVFRVQELALANKSNVKDDEDFFKRPTYLTVSAQLHLEAMLGGFSRVYSLAPAFRADPSTTPHHLAEFYMLEAEVAFVEEIEDICSVIENLVKVTCQRVLNSNDKDIAVIRKSCEENLTVVDSFLVEDYPRITYTEAIALLLKQDLKRQVKWGDDLGKEHEKKLVEMHGSVPVFVTDFPTILKPFYVRPYDHDPRICASVDLLAPHCGELAGGTLREERCNQLRLRLAEHCQGQAQTQTQQLEWYLDLRRYGTVPHGGFGLGFERLLQALTGVHNIRDTIAFPRHMGSCYL